MRWLESGTESIMLKNVGNVNTALNTLYFSPTHVQKYVAYLDFGNGMTEAAMERWASTGTVPGKQFQATWSCLVALAYCAHLRMGHLCHIPVMAHRIFEQIPAPHS